jgi:hypothetical protein
MITLGRKIIVQKCLSNAQHHQVLTVKAAAVTASEFPACKSKTGGKTGIFRVDIRRRTPEKTVDNIFADYFGAPKRTNSYMS